MPVRRTWSLLASMVIVLGGLGVAPASVAAATTHQYPSPGCQANGDHGLQDCIDAAAPGDTIVLASEINPDNGISIVKSLTLRAIDRSLRPRLPFIGVSDATGPVDVTIQDIVIEDGMRVGFSATYSGHRVTLRRLDVGRDAGSDGLSFETQTAASFTLDRSVVRNRDGNQEPALRLSAEDPDGPVVIQVTGSRFTTHGNPQGGAGIALHATGDGTVRADLYSNVIWDVAQCRCGAQSGMTILPGDRIRADVNIVGNTIERSGSDGIQQRNDLTGIGRLSLDVFDNIISHARFFAIRLDSGAPGTLRYRAGYNARSANGLGSNLDGQSAGPGNLSVNPRFVDRADGDVRLRADSPLIDRGLICDPGGLSIRDAAGRHRLKGPSVDIGAYERGAGSASGVVKMGTSGKDTLVGTSGRDILCGFGGDDTLCARDGKGGDYVNGGSGRDKARTDPGDVRRSIEATANCFT